MEGTSDLRIVPIYKIKQNTHRGDYPNPRTLWFLNKETAHEYVDKFAERIKGVNFYGHGGPVFVKMHEEYALHDVRSDRYYSLGPSLEIKIGKPDEKYIPPNKRGGNGE